MQKIVPSLWFDKNCEEAINFYIDTFNGNPNKKSESRIISIKRYEEGMQTPGMPEMMGKILTAVFELEGYQFMALDGGPIFKFNPSVSFHVKCKTKEEVDVLWEKLSNGGKVLMELGSYPFSERYGWTQDKYGVSWQVIHVGEFEGQKFTPVLMFVGDNVGRAEDAVNFYASVFSRSASRGKDGKAQVLARYEKGEEPDKEGTLKYASFALFGQEFGAMDSAREHNFTFNEAISFLVNCEDQKEVDEFWGKLSAVPESEVCGWLKDKFGVSWQIIPKQLGQLLEKDQSNRVMNAMLQMKKIDIDGLKKVYESSTNK